MYYLLASERMSGRCLRWPLDAPSADSELFRCDQEREVGSPLGTGKVIFMVDRAITAPVESVTEPVIGTRSALSVQ